MRDKAEAALARLREALRDIAEAEGDTEGQRFALTRFQCAQLARRALAEEERLARVERLAVETARCVLHAGFPECASSHASDVADALRATGEGGGHEQS